MNDITTGPHFNGIIERYRERLPVSPGMPAVSLGEGDTPLIRLRNLTRGLRAEIELYAKFEGLNPTGSFKDRGMTLAVTQAVDEGARAVICASTGNTSASAAAYAARAGITAFVIIPEGKIAAGKLAQAIIEGAVVIQIDGNFDDGMRIVREVSEEAPVAIVNSINPYRLQGQKTAAFEIVDVLGGAPDYHCLPVGNAGNISAYWMGYSEYAGQPTEIGAELRDGYRCEAVADGTRPRMLGFQAAGAAPFMRGHMVDEPETVATAIRIGHPQSWDLAWIASRESGGWFGEFTDEEILAMQRRLASEEGIFCEPASAVSVAGALREIESGDIPAGSRVVCTLTGHGLKDTDTPLRGGAVEPVRVSAEPGPVRKAILERLG